MAVVLLGAVIAMLGMTGVASAHAALLQTLPADGEVVTTAPSEVTLTFGEPVGLPPGALRALSAAGRPADDGQVRETDGGRTVHLVLRPHLADGSYVVVWRVISADSHPVSGAFTFAIGRQSVDVAKLLGRGNLTRLTAVPPGPGLALGVTRFAGFAALVLLLGSAVFCALLWGTGLERRDIRRTLVWAAVVEGVAAVVAVPLDGVYAAGRGLGEAFTPALLSATASSRYGEATLTRAALGAIAAVLLLQGRLTDRARAWSLAVVGALTAVTWSFAGHGSTGSWQPLAGVADTTHLIAASTWLGGLVLIGWAIRCRAWSPDAAQVILPRWSRTAMLAVGTLVVTGTFAGWREVKTPSALLTTYGGLLLGKDLLVAIMMLLGLGGMQQVGRLQRAASRLAPGEVLGRLRRSTALEAATGAAVLIVTTILVTTTPAAIAYAPPYHGRSTAGPVDVAVDLYPARKGLNGLHIYTVGRDGLTRDVAEVSAFFERGGDRITAHPRRKSLGHDEDLAVVLPATGAWTLTLTVRTSDVDEASTTQTVTVH